MQATEKFIYIKLILKNKRSLMLNKFLPLCRPEFTPTIFGELCHFLM